MKSTTGRHRGREYLIKIAKSTLAAGLIFWLIRNDYLNFGDLKIVLDPSVFMGCLLLASVNLFLCHWRWVRLLQAQNFPQDLRNTFPLTAVGWFFNFFVPGGIGGDLVKGFYIVRDNPARRAPAAISILVDRVIGLYSMLLLSVVPLVLNWNLVKSSPPLTSLATLLFIITVVMTVVLGLAFSETLYEINFLPKILKRLPGHHYLLSIYEAFRAYSAQPSVLLQGIVLSLVAQICAVSFMIVVGEAMPGENIPWDAYFFAVPVGFMISAVPIAPAGIGVGQMASLFLFHIYTGQKSQVGPTSITIFQMTMLLWGLVGAYFYLQMKRPQTINEVAQ